MTDTDQQPHFSEANGGTVFMAQQIWLNEDTNQVESCIGAWEWEQASGVTSAVEPAQYPEEQYPVCSVFWCGRSLHIRADFNQVLKAYLRYKKRFGGQYIRLLAN
ncbi:hypothetical protein SAMN06265337_0637 [Hymenobacter gelipurpurascens]|uniref:Uncharacterized protein n=1 Tax=Hymenobacter gelipurpurascens TaxID=89968 RepID=A0A212T8V5_9BACT|nr:hypothetical protein [Hymenobacter gelipurpurascens]SNC62271.1 hypothetical protein SAMN06265337_0637 [Hymenobacter gelipurpurascens]